MSALSPSVLLATVTAGVVYFACLDRLKIWLFAWLALR
jgi:hypothetical protein